MNKVFISGKITQQPVLRMEGGEIPHLMLEVSVGHKKRNGEIRSENYRVSAWNRVAEWGVANLRRGQVIAIQGYLSQTSGETVVTEVTAEEFLPAAVTVNTIKVQNGEKDSAAGDDSKTDDA